MDVRPENKRLSQANANGEPHLPPFRASPVYNFTFDVMTLVGYRKADPPEEHALFTCGPKELNLILLRARRLVNDCARK